MHFVRCFPTNPVDVAAEWLRSELLECFMVTRRRVNTECTGFELKNRWLEKLETSLSGNVEFLDTTLFTRIQGLVIDDNFPAHHRGRIHVGAIYGNGSHFIALLVHYKDHNYQAHFQLYLYDDMQQQGLEINNYWVKWTLYSESYFAEFPGQIQHNNSVYNVQTMFFYSPTLPEVMSVDDD